METPPDGRTRAFWWPIRGASMAPGLQPGDDVLFAPWDRDILPGDIVLARVDGSFVVHRVAWVGPGHVQTRGDANVNPDPPVRRAAVPYRVTARRRMGVEAPPPGPFTPEPVRRARRRALVAGALRGILGWGAVSS